MKRKILVFISIFTVLYSSAQIIISNDTNFCSSQPHDLYAMSAIQSSMAIDDQHDSIVSLGFNFDFYGINKIFCKNGKLWSKLIIYWYKYLTNNEINSAKVKRKIYIELF